MKIVRNIFIVLTILVVLGVVGIFYIRVDVDEDTLPTNVFDTDSNLTTLINIELLQLYLRTATDEYTVVEEILNLTIQDSIKENLNPDYDPLSDCETTECNFIIHEENYYVNFVWAELTEDNQMMIHISLGNDKIMKLNTIITLYLDIEIDFIGSEVSLTLDRYELDDVNLSMKMLDRIFGLFDKAAIEDAVTEGKLDLDEYSYTISFSPF